MIVGQSSKEVCGLLNWRPLDCVQSRGSSAQPSGEFELAEESEEPSHSYWIGMHSPIYGSSIGHKKGFVGMEKIWTRIVVVSIAIKES